MNYEQARNLAAAWTSDKDIELDGWRSVIAVLNQRIIALERVNESLNEQNKQLISQVECLAIDLKIKDHGSLLPKSFDQLVQDNEGKN
jgi:hypothetical protein